MRSSSSAYRAIGSTTSSSRPAAAPIGPRAQRLPPLPLGERAAVRGPCRRAAPRSSPSSTASATASRCPPILLVIILVIFGPSKLGDVGGALGRAIRDFKGAMNEPDGPKPVVKSADSVASEPKADKSI
ncbi:MAG: twin-arginine translocase TatA/TatE family subunit [Deltaproteobacteria bacterium]|nr:twin-arginine translocase TatA/TatE family subunit [Deltaproteobacteria bacterium]